MKFRRFPLCPMLAVSLSAAGLTFFAKAEPAVHEAEKSMEAWVADLSDEAFKTREKATLELWRMGDPAAPLLKKAAASDDPELVYRAEELLQKFQLGITPSTDPEVIDLVSRYGKANHSEKLGIFGQLQKKRAWRPLLKLYASETDAEILTARLRQFVHQAVISAARQSLLSHDPAMAREYLEMAPADEKGLLALADFHQSQGSLSAELKRAKTLSGPQGVAWTLALYRASGQLEAARDLAAAQGEVSISVTMAALCGDPIPWLRASRSAGSEQQSLYETYQQVAIQQWQGQPLRPADLAPLIRAVTSQNEIERENAMSALFLLGETTAGEQALLKESPLEAFSYFESMERIPEALRALGLDPASPAFSEWVGKRVEKFGQNDGGEEGTFPSQTSELVVLAHFLEQRGLHESAKQAFLPPMLALAERDEKVFLQLLSSLFGSNERLFVRNQAAAALATEIAISWVGEREKRWEDVVFAAFGGEDLTRASWEWLGEIALKASLSERFRGMLALSGMGNDPERLRETWSERMWQALKLAPADARRRLLERMMFFAALHPEVTYGLRLWDELPAEMQNQPQAWRNRISDLSAVARWKEAATYLTKLIELFSKEELTAEHLAMHACAAACLRQAGRDQEAVQMDRLVEKLALGDGLTQIAGGYALGYDLKRSDQWWAKAVRQSERGSPVFEEAIEWHFEALKEQKAWLQAASAAEVMAQLSAAGDGGRGVALARLRVRFHSKMFQAAAHFQADRPRALRLFEECFTMYPIDGGLADDFFPVLRQMGRTEEYERWFAVSWERLTKVVTAYPDSDNTLNTAAWLAARACRKLSEAENYQRQVLLMNPEQAAYLDTMAEVHFAMGDRAKALEWSARAVLHLPGDFMLRRQNMRFRQGPIPK